MSSVVYLLSGFLIFTSLVYLIAAAVTFFKRGFERTSNLWMVFLISASLLSMGQAYVNRLPGLETSQAWIGLRICGFIVLTVLFYLVCRSSLNAPGKALPLIRLWRKPPDTTARNQSYYWWPTWLFFLTGNILSLTSLVFWANLLLVAAVLFVTVIVTTRKIPHIRYTMQQAVSLLILGLPLALLWWIGLAMVEPLNRITPQATPYIVAGCMAAASIGSMQLSMRLARRIANRIFPTTEYDPSRILREYSIGISNITSPNLLATVSIGLISEAVEIHRGILFNVHFEANPQKSAYELQSLGGMGAEKVESGLLAANSPIATFLRHKRNPLFQHEIESEPDFQAASAQERAWLASLNMEVFVPIHTKEDWIGLIALGPKASGLEFYKDDLVLVSALADQMSLALQNARLIDSLMRVNNDFRRAYTAMEQSNRQLQQAVLQLEKLDKTKTDFISISSHELRTPLTVMRGYSEMLIEDPSMLKNAIHAKMVTGIHAGIMRLNEIVESMLDVASIDARSMQLHKENISIQATIRKLLSKLDGALRERQITLSQENLVDLPAVEADPEAISKVFYQVIINAIKYTPDGGRITVSGLSVSPGQMGFTDGGIQIIISDTGIGIDPAQLELIFNKFHQTGNLALHSTGKTKFKGAGPGLGLAIAKGIVEAHGGKIWAESKGHDEENFPGSQFHIILPLHN